MIFARAPFLFPSDALDVLSKSVCFIYDLLLCGTLAYPEQYANRVRSFA
jgi:hypothetical protein